VIQIYTGEGKGKTTASLGLALRALGHGWKVLMIQFMKKSEEYGEVRMARRLEGFEIEQYGSGDFILSEPNEKDLSLAEKGLKRAYSAARQDYKLVILDEILGAIALGLFSLEEAEQLLEAWPKEIELVLTGRNAPPKLIDRADLASEIREIKHPYREGVPARLGIE
jgi:cob(I)alamin adenosyltransferase